MKSRDFSSLRTLDPKAVAEALSKITEESDRGAILVCVSILDDAFKSMLEDLLDNGSKDARGRLLNSPMGALSSFSSKVDLAYCIGILPKFVYDDIRLLKKLRNECAHGWGRFDITQDIVDKYIEPMGMRRALAAALEKMPDIDVRDVPPRRVLLGTLAALVTWINIYRPRDIVSADPSVE